MRATTCVLYSARACTYSMPSVASHHAPTPLVCKIIWNKKGNSRADEGNLLFQLTCTNFKWASHYKCKLEMLNYIFILLVTRACALTLARLYTLYLAAKRWILM